MKVDDLRWKMVKNEKNKPVPKIEEIEKEMSVSKVKETIYQMLDGIDDEVTLKGIYELIQIHFLGDEIGYKMGDEIS